MLVSRRTEEGEGDFLAHFFEFDDDGHVEDERFGCLWAVHDIRHHARAFFQLDDGDRIGRFEASGRSMVDDIAEEPAASRRVVDLDIATTAFRAERPRRKVARAAIGASL